MGHSFLASHHQGAHLLQALERAPLIGLVMQHPTILHAILADGYQEIIEIVLVPSFTCMLGEPSSS